MPTYKVLIVSDSGNGQPIYREVMVDAASPADAEAQVQIEAHEFIIDAFDMADLEDCYGDLDEWYIWSNEPKYEDGIPF